MQTRWRDLEHTDSAAGCASVRVCLWGSMMHGMARRGGGAKAVHVRRANELLRWVLGLGLVAAAIVTGRSPTLIAIVSAYVMVGLGAPLLARKLRLPSWAPDEAYVSRLRRWYRAR
jgi:hypothetical protein